jgi:hypothetical protein
MEPAKHAVILLIVFFSIAGAVKPIEQTATAKISETRLASCVVKVTANPSILPMRYETIESLLRSSNVAGKAGREVLGLSLGQSLGLFTTEPLSGYSSISALPELSPKSKPEPELGTEKPGGLYEKEATPAPMPLRATLPTLPDLAGEQTIFLRLAVELPEDVKAAAEEYMDALIDNLRQTLIMAYRDVGGKLTRQLADTENQRNNAQSQLSNIMEQTRATEPPPPIKQDPTDMAVYEQLDQIVDLSMLSPEMPFSEAIGILKNSVKPPLKIVMLWRDLCENAEIEPDTAINMDGLSEVRLGTALELLLKSVEDGFTTLDYVILNGVITIATKDSDSLPNNLETRVYDISSLGHPVSGADNLIQMIQDTIEPDSWFEYGGECSINIYLGKKLAILQSPEVHRKIQEFLQATKIDIPIDVPVDTPVDMLIDKKHDLLRFKQNLDMDIAQLEARHSAIEEQIRKMSEQITTKVELDPVSRELQEIVDMYSKRYGEFEKLVSEGGRVSSPELESEMNKLVQAKIELAKRRGELSRTAGGDQLARFNDKLADVMIALAEKKAQLDVVDKQLKQAESQLITATTYDPQASQIRFAKQAIEVADRQIHEIETRLANLRSPTVTILGI